MAGFRFSMSQSLSSTNYPSHHYSGLQPKINLPYGQLRVFSSLSSTSSTQPYKPVLISAFPSASVNQSSSLSTLPFASSGIGFAGNDWIHKLRDAWQSEVGTVPDSFYLTSSILAFLILPRLLRICYKFTVHDHSVLSTSLFRLQVPYENSLWKALEDPLRCLVIFIALTKTGTMVTSTAVAHTLAQTWRVAFMFSVVWFLRRWKASLFSFACESFGKHDHAKILTLDRFASGCICVVGLMGSALACGVAVYPITIIGGIVGMSIAYATRDILETICSGLSIQFLKPFSVGDTVKVGSVEGRVVEMGLVTTWLLNDMEIPVMIPNSMFASQAVSNKSRPPFHAMTIKIPIPADDTDKAPGILNDIESMLRSNPNVFLGKEPPHCFLSQTENSSAELTLKCNLKNTNYQDLPFTKTDIFLQTLQTLKEHGFLLKKEGGAKI